MTDDNDRNAVISIAIRDKQALYMSYMPFIDGGGLFVPSPKAYDLGEELFLLVHIMDEPDPINISGKVVWVTPKGALGNRPVGVGVQIMNDEKNIVSELIESKLGTSLSLTRATHTM